jgi:uroporphyrinogen III methyltransferase/synthase
LDNFYQRKRGKVFFQRLKEQKKDIRRLKDIHLGAIGPHTKEALENFGLMVDFVPESYRAEEISAGLKYSLFPGARVLLPRAKGARDILVTALTDLGTHVDEVTAYQTKRDKGNIDLVRFMLTKGHIHVITFTSSSTVRNFISMLNAPDLCSVSHKTQKILT